MEIIDEAYYGNGEFDFIKDNATREFLKSAHKAINICELWNWMRIYEPTSGFMWSSAAELDRLNTEMWKDPINSNHSGASHSHILREMQYIAKNGYNKYKNNYYNNNI